MNYLEAATAITAAGELKTIIPKKPSLNRALRKIRHIGEIALWSLFLTQCGNPVAINGNSKLPTAQVRGVQNLPTETLLAATTQTIETPPPQLEEQHQILFGILEVDNRQRLNIRQTDSDVQFEIAASPQAVPPRFRNPFQGATVTQIFESDSEIAKTYGISLCLLLKDGITNVCFNNIPIISEETRKAFQDKTPLEPGIILGTIGSATKIPTYPDTLPDETRSKFRGLISATRNGQKIRLQEVLPAFTNRDPRNDPQ